MKKEMGKSAAINNRARIYKRHIVFGAHKKKEEYNLSRLIMPENKWQPLRGESQGFSAETWELILV